MKKICYCKKDYHYKDEILFEKGKYYKYKIEIVNYCNANSDDEKCAWVIFNKNGKDDKIGRRFFFNITDISYNRFRYIFNEYFENERLVKLKKINENFLNNI